MEGPTDDAAILARRADDIRALLGTLFVSTGTIMLAAGDEFGRSQHGNNNAYCQNMPVEWDRRDLALEAHVAALAARRAKRLPLFARFPETGRWSSLVHEPMADAHWQDQATGGFIYDFPEDWGSAQLRISRSERAVRWSG